MKDLILELIPHAPGLGLYTVPSIPENKVRNAVHDYARTAHPDEVIALYDATFLGNAKDGAIFLPDRFFFQNNNLEPAQEIRYEDLVRVNTQKKLIGGQKVLMDVNRGRATISLVMDFSGKPEAAEYVARFLHEAMIRGAEQEMDTLKLPDTPPPTTTDVPAVLAVLEPLRDDGRLSEADYHKIESLLRGSR